ncbi:MAG TPA: hypothetical protein VMU08_09540 [Rhizomicrobium sp.]|nr:hypothetical protein [Rhizomicrobium sp.]
MRIAMWSGPRNISTAMMRSFENRTDTDVIDEPFYAAYLAVTGLDHPMRNEVLRSQSTDWRKVESVLLGPSPHGAPIFYQKQMTHHMLPEFGTAWMSACCNVFLIRRPDEVVASYIEKRGDISLADIGVVRQAELFDQVANRLGRAPPVIDSADVSAAPEPMLTALCVALGIPFSERMLSWPKGRRRSDGVWAPAWYDQVEQSTGFVPRAKIAPPRLPPALASVADEARPYYENLARWKITTR